MVQAYCSQGSDHLNKILPIVFDGNEWFIRISFCVIAPIPFILPRRFPTIATIVLMFLAIGIPNYVDFILGVPPLDLYDVNDTNKYELLDMALYYLNAPFAYLFVYFFDKWKISGLRIALYVSVWSIAATAYEALAVYCHVFKYKGWNLAYSFVFYLAIQSFYLLLYYLIKKKYNRTKRDTGPDWI
jgi:hypothetical protein